MLAPQWKTGLSFRFLLGSSSVWENVPLCRLESCLHRQKKASLNSVAILPRNLCASQLVDSDLGTMKLSESVLWLINSGNGRTSPASRPWQPRPSWEFIHGKHCFTLLFKPCDCLLNKYIYSINTVIYPSDTFTPGWRSLLEPMLPRPLLLA